MNENETKQEPKYPHIKVHVNGDRSGFTLVSRALHQMRKAGVSKAERDAFYAEACEPYFDVAIKVVKRYVTVEP